jgi:glycerophosphoryl diester phosphodiesterase
MAHRGNSAVCPENTLASFRQAFSDDCDILETDLHLTSDGEFVLIHDETLDRTTDGQGPVVEKSLAEIKKLSASYGRAEYAQERIPTLPDLAEILPSSTYLAIELKTDHVFEKEIANRLVKQLEELGLRERVLFLSFSQERLRAMKAAAPDMPSGFITMNNPWPINFEILGPFFPLVYLNPFYVKLAQRQGKIVCPLDPWPDSRLGYYRFLGVDAVVSNDPGKTRQALKQLQK